MADLAVVSSAAAAAWMEDEDAPLPPLPTLGAPLAAAEQQQSTEQPRTEECAVEEQDEAEVGAANSFEEPVEWDGAVSEEAAPPNGNRSHTSDAQPAQHRRPQQQQPPTTPLRQTETERGAAPECTETASDKLDEQLPVRHRRKRARLLSDDEEDEEAEGRDAHTPPQPERQRQVHHGRHRSVAVADAFDFDQCAEQSRGLAERAIDQSDIDIFALLQSEAAALSSEAEERRQRAARMEVEQSLTHVLVNEKRRQDEEEKMRRAAQAEVEMEDDYEYCY